MHQYRLIGNTLGFRVSKRNSFRLSICRHHPNFFWGLSAQPFKLPVKPIKQEIASDIGLIAYGVLYFSIAMSNLLQPRWFTVGLPAFLQPIWVRRGLAGVGIVLIAAGIYGIYHLYVEQSSDNLPE